MHKPNKLISLSDDMILHKKPQKGSKLSSWYDASVAWFKQTMMVLGVSCLLVFIWVNFLEKEFSLQFPAYASSDEEAYIKQLEEQLVKLQSQVKGKK